MSPIEWPTLPVGDRSPIRKRTINLHADQMAILDAAIRAAHAAGPYDSSTTITATGDAIARIAQAYLDAHVG